jgi:hypothetical protein
MELANCSTGHMLVVFAVLALEAWIGSQARKGKIPAGSLLGLIALSGLVVVGILVLKLAPLFKRGENEDER